MHILIKNSLTGVSNFEEKKCLQIVSKMKKLCPMFSTEQTSLDSNVNRLFFINYKNSNVIVSLLTALVFQVVWMRNGREVKIGKKYEYVTIDRKRILAVHNVTEEDVGIYECALSEDKVSLQLALRGVWLIKTTAPV